MQRMKRAAIAVTGLLLWCSPAAAGSWEVTQTATLGNGTNTTTLSQADNQGARQAINAIVLDSGATVTQATQTVTVNGNLTLEQGGGDGNRQAANLIEAGTVIAAEQGFAATGEVSLRRTAGGDNNYQALNMVLAGTIDNLSQTVTIRQLSFLTTGGTDNIQAGNLVQTDHSWTSIHQSFVSSGTVTFAGDSGARNLQAGNAIITGQTWNGETTTMYFSASEVDTGYRDTNENSGSIKAANYYGPASLL